MTFFHIDLLKNLYCLFEKTENKQNRGRGWPFKKKLFGILMIYLPSTNHHDPQCYGQIQIGYLFQM